MSFDSPIENILHPPLPGMSKDEGILYRFLLELWNRSGGYTPNTSGIKDLKSTVQELNTLQGIRQDINVQRQIDSKVSDADLGTMAQQDADSVAINGGTISQTNMIANIYVDLTANRALATNGSNQFVSSDASLTELNYLSGVNAPIQGQIDGKEPIIISGTIDDYYRGNKTWANFLEKSRSGVSSTVVGLLYSNTSGIISLDTGYYIPKTTDEVNNWQAPLEFSSNTAYITQSNATTDGYLSSIDWNTFNSKEPTITFGTTAQYWRGDKTWQTLNATAVGLGNVTNDTQTKAAIVPNTLPTSGQILVGNAGGTAYAPQTMSSDVTLTSAGVATIANNAVTNAKLAQAGANTYKGNNTGVLANVSDISTNTAFNQSFETSTANIKPNGTVSVGALSTIPRADHIHAFSATQPLVYNATTGNISLGARSIPIPVETNSNFNGYRVRSVTGTGNFDFNFTVPNDFYSLVACYVQGFVSSGAVGVNKNIDITVQYNAGAGQLYNQFTASDTATLYNLTGLTNRLYNLPVTALLTSLTAGSVGTINVNHNSIGGAIYYICVLLIYV